LVVRFEHLYVHVPFCARRCVYCDFSIAVRPTVPVADYLEGIEADLRIRHSTSDFDLATLYLGGGTPSRLGGEGVAQLIDLIRSRAHIRKDAEVTLETNPEDVNPAAVAAWKAAGVNRVSLGVQSFDDKTLAWMHRVHDSSAAERAVQVLLEGGLANVSIDLIFALPQERQRDWTRDLEKAVQLGVSHVSLYGLTIEPQTPLGRWVARNQTAEAPEENYETEFLSAHSALTDARFEHYEVSNYGKAGYHSRHNWAYWLRRPYAGLGPSAHEFDGSVRRWNRFAYVEWLATLNRGESPVEGSERLTHDQVDQEGVYLGLRTREGIALDTSNEHRIARLLESGWGDVSETGRFRLTATGWLRLDAIATDLTDLRSRY
jgi:oxygen-independent coproporphyrinogen-3 oxidase